MKRQLTYILSLFSAVTLGFSQLSAQTSVGINTQTPNPNAVLELVSPQKNQGLLITSLTDVERTNLGKKLGLTESGLMIFNTSDTMFYFWSGKVWHKGLADLSDLYEITSTLTDSSTSHYTGIKNLTYNTATNTYDIGVLKSDLTLLKTAVDKLIAEQNLTSILTKGNEANNKIAKLTAPTDALDAANKQYVDAADASLSTEIGKTNSNVTQLTNRVTTAESTLTDHETRITDNTSKISTNTSDITAVTTRVTAAETKIADHETRITTNTTDIATNATNISSVTNRVTANEATLTDHEARITKEEGLTQIVRDSIQDVYSEVLKNKTNIGTLRDSVKTNISNIVTLRDTVKTNIKNINTLRDTAKTNMANIMTLRDSVKTNIKNISTLRDTVKTNMTNIVTLRDSVKTNITNISTLRDTAKTNIANIVTLRDSVKTNITNIKTLRDSVKINFTSIDASKVRIKELSDSTIAEIARNDARAKASSDSINYLYKTGKTHLPKGAIYIGGANDTANAVSLNGAVKIVDLTGKTEIQQGVIQASNLGATITGTALGIGTTDHILTSNGDGSFKWTNPSTTPVDPNNITLNEGKFFVGNPFNKAQEADKNTIPLSGFAPAGANVSVGNYKLTEVATPTDATDAVNKSYSDGVDSALSKRITANKNSIITTNNNLNTLRDSVKTNIKNIVTLRDSVKTNITNINTLRDSVKTNTKNIVTLRDSVKTNITNINTLRDSVKTNIKNIVTLRDSVKTNITNINTLRDSVKTNIKNIVTLRDSVKTNITNINTLRDTVKTTIKNMVTLRDSVKTSITNISTLRDSVKTITQDIKLGNFHLEKLHVFVGDAKDSAKAVSLNGAIAIVDVTGKTEIQPGVLRASNLGSTLAGAALTNGTTDYILTANGDGTFKWTNPSTTPVDPSNITLTQDYLFVGNSSGKAEGYAKNTIPLSGFGAAGANVDMGSYKLTSLQDPSANQDAATKLYVDNKVVNAGGSVNLTSAHIFVGNASGKATDMEVTGDVTLDNTGDIQIKADAITAAEIATGAVESTEILDGTIATADIADNAINNVKMADDAIGTAELQNSSVTLAKMANMATASFLGRNTAGAGAPEVLSVATTKTMLSLSNVENTALSTWTGSTNITTLGTISSGTWNGSLISGQYGGTGVNNAGKTITLGGNLSTIGAFPTTLTATAATNLTLPTSGTLATLAGAEALTNKTINGLTPTSQATGFTIAGGTVSKTLTVSGNADVSGTNTGDVTLSGENYLSISGQAITIGAVNLSGSNVTGTLAAARFPALTGDVTNTAGTLSTTVSKINGVAFGTITATDKNILVADGSQWNSVALAGDATISNTGSLSLVNSATARTNIGLGTASSPTFTGATLSALNTKGVVINTAAGVLGTSKGTGFLKDDGSGTLTYDNTTYLTATSGVTTFSGGSTGLTPNSATSGAVTLAGTLAVTNGGTGLSSTTANRILYSSANNTIAELATANGGILNTSATGVPSITATPTLGVAGTTAGTITLSGATSGTVKLQPTAVAGAGTVLTLPASSGTLALTNGSITTNNVPRWDGSTLINSSIWCKTDATSTKLYLGNTTIDPGLLSYDLEVAGTFKTAKIYHSSDARWKKNIQTVDNALDKVQKLRGVTYEWRTTEFPDKHFSEGTQIGLIAQEVEKVLPELVNTGTDGYKAVEYANIVSVLIEAIKEQQALITKQEAEIAKLQADVSANASYMQQIQTMQVQMVNMQSQIASLSSLVQLMAPTASSNK